MMIGRWYVVEIVIVALGNVIEVNIWPNLVLISIYLTLQYLLVSTVVNGDCGCGFGFALCENHTVVEFCSLSWYHPLQR